MSWALPRLLRRVGAALVHTQYAVPLRCPCPAVVTVHDLSFERDPTLMRSRDRAVFRRVVPRAVRRAARVLTVSQRSQDDLVELYGVSPERVVVTPNGVDPAFHPGEAEEHGYALAVGAIEPRKDQLAALAAAREVGLPLVVVGPTRDAGLAAELRRGGARLEGYVSDRAARRALSRRRVPRAGVPVRGLRAPGARGDGERDACRHRSRPGARSRSWAMRPWSSSRGSWPTASAPRLQSATGSPGPGSSARVPSPGERLRRRRCAVYRRGVRDERLGGRRLAWSRRRGRTASALSSLPQVDECVVIANLPGSVASCRRWRARDRERRVRYSLCREHEPRHRCEQRRVRPGDDAGRRSRAGCGRRPREPSPSTRPRCGIAGPQLVWPDGTWQPSRGVAFPPCAARSCDARRCASCAHPTSISAITTCSTSARPSRSRRTGCSVPACSCVEQCSRSSAAGTPATGTTSRTSTSATGP